jgi:sugar phosphate isomerase/epimerase
MKIAGSSASFARRFADGSLTQLEWLDACARSMGLDGVAFDAADFPRTDGEYVAQLKKLAVDLGLTVAALACDEIFSARDDDEGRAALERALELAVGLGAPLAIVRTPAADGTPAAWNDLVAAAKRALRSAKARNVTLAVRNAADTLCASAADCKRLAKDVDSAWLRFAPDARFLAGAESESFASSAVAFTLGLADDAEEDARLVAAVGDFRPFLICDGPLEESPDPGARYRSLFEDLFRRRVKT